MTETGPQHNTHTHTHHFDQAIIFKSHRSVSHLAAWWRSPCIYLPARVYICPQNGHHLLINLSEAFRRLVGPTVRRVNPVDNLSFTSTCLFLASNTLIHSLSGPALQRQSVYCFFNLFVLLLFYLYLLATQTKHWSLCYETTRHNSSTVS